MSTELTEERGWERKRGREGMEEKVKEEERTNPGELEAPQFQIAM